MAFYKNDRGCSCISETLQPPWTVAHQAPLSKGFSRQKYWSWLPFPSPGDLPDTGIKSRSPALQANSLPSEPPGKPHKWVQIVCVHAYMLTHVWLFVIPWAIAHQAFLSMGFSWQKYWSGLPFFFSRGSSWSGIQLKSLVFPSLAGGFLTSWAAGEALYESREATTLQVFP